MATALGFPSKRGKYARTTWQRRRVAAVQAKDAAADRWHAEAESRQRCSNGGRRKMRSAFARYLGKSRFCDRRFARAAVDSGFFHPPEGNCKLFPHPRSLPLLPPTALAQFLSSAFLSLLSSTYRSLIISKINGCCANSTKPRKIHFSFYTYFWRENGY